MRPFRRPLLTPAVRRPQRHVHVRLLRYLPGCWWPLSISIPSMADGYVSMYAAYLIRQQGQSRNRELHMSNAFTLEHHRARLILFVGCLRQSGHSQSPTGSSLMPTHSQWNH